MANVVAQGISRKQIRAFTKYVRELCGMTDRIYFPVVEFLEIILPNLIDDFTYEIVESIRKNGITESIKYVEHNGSKYVVDGHHRLRAAKQLGLDKIPTQKVSLPYKGYKTINDLLWFD